MLVSSRWRVLRGVGRGYLFMLLSSRWRVVRGGVGLPLDVVFV